jgi:ferredoxin-NADP reductase
MNFTDLTDMATERREVSAAENKLTCLFILVSRGHAVKELEAAVAEVIRETPDTSTLVLAFGNAPLHYEAGQFLTIDPHQFEELDRFVSFFEDLKGRREPPRAYSMSSAPHEPHIAFTVKEELYISGGTKYPPLLSPVLVRRTPPGTRFMIRGFAGPYILTNKILTKTNHLFHICAGSGIVPNFAIIKSALVTHPEVRHTLLYSSRTWDDIIFRIQFDALSSAHPDQLTVIHTLTREKNLPAPCSNVRTGRIDPALLKEFVPAPPKCHFFVCGPAISAFDRELARQKGEAPQPRFMESVLANLTALGVSRDQITHEAYG